ncbi:MAG: serine hydrolase domain-containing protein [Ferrimicrobium sp.]
MSAERLTRLNDHFNSYVDNDQLAGYDLLVARRGNVAHRHTYGLADLASATPISQDTIYRIYSMTKPITSIVAMQLVEEGWISLTDPIDTYLPAFADMTVYAGGSSQKPTLRPASEPIRIWHLLTHTAGFTYGFHHQHPVDAIYRSNGYEWGVPLDMTLEGAANHYASLPLLFDPGSAWNYSVATDVLGRLIEVVTQQTLAEAIRKRVTDPLGMADTSFSLTQDRLKRVATLYTRAPATNQLHPLSGFATPGRVTSVDSGGGGLFSTMEDYLRFCSMLTAGGIAGSTRILGPRTLDYMTQNHLPGNHDVEEFGLNNFEKGVYNGVGFGLGFSVVMNPVAAKIISSRGEYGWGGAASTAFFIAPQEELAVIFLTQLLPSSTYPIHRELSQLVYQAIVE